MWRKSWERVDQLWTHNGALRTNNRELLCKMQKTRSTWRCDHGSLRLIRSGRRCFVARCGQGSLVEEAEAPYSQVPSDVFVLRWLGLGADVNLDAMMVAEECEIIYQTCGCQSFGGLDRGRALSAMDEELLAMLQPFGTPKLSFTATPPAQMVTQVFWDEPGFGPVVTQRDRLSRSVKVMVYSYQEQGE